MKAMNIGQRLVELCKQGKNMESIDTLYADTVESIEATDPPLGDRVTRGIEAVRRKNNDWGEQNTIHEQNVEGPYPHGDDRFAVRFSYDITNKPSGQRMKLDEIGVFTLAGGKVIREEFYYAFG
ncbi:MAG TPA: nuclear transport factor 2 family protein [Polyangiales bacterium]|nr:nuclear transport factor 2 family protein [Polyangiales bacterium]